MEMSRMALSLRHSLVLSNLYALLQMVLRGATEGRPRAQEGNRRGPRLRLLSEWEGDVSGRN